VNAPRQLAELRDRTPDLLLHGIDLRGGGSGQVLHRQATQQQTDREQVLLGTVVEIAFDPPPLAVGRLDDSGA
jgi:hypothetical protein